MYFQITAPVAHALKFIEGEYYMYQAYLLPTIIKLYNSLEAINDLRYCQSMLSVLLKSIQNRFQNDVGDMGYIKAVLLHPLFKNHTMFNISIWGESLTSLKENAGKELVNEISQLLNQNLSGDKEQSCSQTLMNVDKRVVEYFEMSASAANEQNQIAPSNQDKALEIFSQYIADKSFSLDVLNLPRFKHIKKLFIKYNTSIPSSASSERLFSLGKYTLNCNRLRLTDKHFEKQLLLKANGFANR